MARVVFRGSESFCGNHEPHEPHLRGRYYTVAGPILGLERFCPGIDLLGRHEDPIVYRIGSETYELHQGSPRCEAYLFRWGE